MERSVIAGREPFHSGRWERSWFAHSLFPLKYYSTKSAMLKVHYMCEYSVGAPHAWSNQDTPDSSRVHHPLVTYDIKITQHCNQYCHQETSKLIKDTSLPVYYWHPTYMTIELWSILLLITLPIVFVQICTLGSLLIIPQPANHMGPIWVLQFPYGSHMGNSCRAHIDLI